MHGQSVSLCPTGQRKGFTHTAVFLDVHRLRGTPHGIRATAHGKGVGHVEFLCRAVADAVADRPSRRSALKVAVLQQIICICIRIVFQLCAVCVDGSGAVGHVPKSVSRGRIKTPHLKKVRRRRCVSIVVCTLFTCKRCYQIFPFFETEQYQIDRQCTECNDKKRNDYTCSVNFVLESDEQQIEH